MLSDRLRGTLSTKDNITECASTAIKWLGTNYLLLWQSADYHEVGLVEVGNFVDSKASSAFKKQQFTSKTAVILNCDMHDLF